MILSKKTYVKKYVGKVNNRLTNSYNKRGNTVSKGQKIVKKYDNIFAIKRGNDIVGYLVDGKIHASKTKGDRKKTSAQKWEKKGGKANGCSNPNCQCGKGCGCNKPENKTGGKANGCSNPNCQCGKGCGCNKPKNKTGGSRNFSKGCECMENYSRQMFN